MSATQTKPTDLEPDNPEMAEAIFEHAREQEEQHREEQTKAARDKQAILNAVQSETVDVRLYGTRIEFTVLTGEEEDWIEDTSSQFLEVDDEDDLDPEEFRRYQRARDEMKQLLADHSVPDEFDYEFWSKLPSAKRQQTLGRLREGGIDATRAGNSQ